MIGQVENELKLSWHKAQVRQLERDGKCAFCYCDIERLKDEGFEVEVIENE